MEGKLAMLTRLTADQRDGPRRRRQADDVGSFVTWGIQWLLPLVECVWPLNEEKRRIFGGWVKSPILFSC